MALLQRRLQLVNSATEPCWEGQVIKVAFATSDMRHVDQHFGAAESFALYMVDAGHSQLLEASKFGALEMDGNEDKLATKIDALQGCIAVYSQAVGASAITQLKAKKIQPVKVEAGTAISQLLYGLQDELARGAQGWLGRAIAQLQPADSARFDVMDAEGWAE
ncbi:MAG: NifB/NifX family molybdenum-iron cluster-binding protein [Gammaproteobacteria bacterium]